MSSRPIIGIRRFMIPIPRFLWRREVAGKARAVTRSLAFMTEDHHRVRDFAVRELPRRGRPLAPALIAEEMDLSAARTQEILDELEKRLTFLFRNDDGAVAWAYPATAEATPHHAAFSTGERLDAA